MGWARVDKVQGAPEFRVREFQAVEGVVIGVARGCGPHRAALAMGGKQAHLKTNPTYQRTVVLTAN